MQSHHDSNLYYTMLRQAGLKKTRLRTELFLLLSSAKRPLTIQEMVHQTSTAHFVTVYRAVDLLYKAHILKQVPLGFKNTFELGDAFKPHHHHATCDSCGTITSVHDPSIEHLMETLALQAGLSQSRHHLELYGICTDCQNATATTPDQNQQPPQ